jgi:FixJ family two-component response regulator
MANSAASGCVCVVDADRSAREGLSRLLGSVGLDCRPFDSAAAFLREAPHAEAACALLDLSDKGVRDAGVRSQLRALAESLPLIALTALDDAQTRRVARELGAQACFRKPVDAAALLDSIDWVTHGRRAGTAS